MKKFSSEFGHNYKNYSFGYANYCLYEKGDQLSEIYASGHLPYSGSYDAENVLYQARSARVPMKNFDLTSENRRIAKKFDGKFKRVSKPLKDFDTQDKEFLSFCVNYFAKRHGPNVMPIDRLKMILKSSLINNVVTYSEDKKPRAYVLECSSEDMVHFWFSFYDLSLIYQSLGMWLMLDSARSAKAKGANHFYVGTVYGEKALYKTAFKNLEYWDGQKWTANIKKLKELARSDVERATSFIDSWKKEIKLF